MEKDIIKTLKANTCAIFVIASLIMALIAFCIAGVNGIIYIMLVYAFLCVTIATGSFVSEFINRNKPANSMSKILIDEDIINRAINAISIGIWYVEKTDLPILDDALDDLLKVRRSYLQYKHGILRERVAVHKNCSR